MLINPLQPVSLVLFTVAPNNPTGRLGVDALTPDVPVLSVLNGSNQLLDLDYGANLCKGGEKIGNFSGGLLK